MLKEIEQVGRLLESEQTGACLAYIESLEKNHPNCACLTAAKLSAYRAENRWQEALPVAERFHADEPDNPTAAAEYALALVVTGNPKLAISTLVDAFERSKADTVQSTLLHAALQVGSYLLFGGLAVPAIAIGNVLKEIPATAEQANRLLYSATADTEVPLMLRDWAFDFNCPDGFPGKTTFEEVAVLVRLMRWKQALALLEPLAQHADAWSGVWRNIAALRFWLLDIEEGSEALKTYASLPNTPQEDAVDAESVRFLFVPDPFGDQVDVLTVEYVITDAEQVLEKLLSDPLFHRVDTSKMPFSPPPRACFQILDRPFADSEAPLALENVPLQRAIAVLFGKETDREARFYIQSIPDYEHEAIEAKIRDMFGDLVQVPGEFSKRNPTSKTFLLTQCQFCPSPQQKGVDAEAVEKLLHDYFEKFFVETWLVCPLGLLDGKTPVEAATEPKYTIPLWAMVQTMEWWIPEEVGNNVTTALRTRLGLPIPGTITVAEGSDEDPLMVLDAYPVWRWHRFDVEKLSTDILSGGLQIVLGMREMRAAVRFAEELLNRPMDSMPFPTRVMAFEALIPAAQAKGDFEQALLWVERAKNESAAQNVPDAAWCLHEIMLRLMQRNPEAASEVTQYLLTHYGNDATVMNALRELFVRIGMMNPDGSPSAAAMQAESQEEEQRIWTPDSGAPAGSTASSKLWVPD